jgi:hypothetical protein
MKKITLCITLLITSSISFGQSIFETLESMEEVSSFVVNKEAFQLLQKFSQDTGESTGKDNEALEVFQMVQNLKELKVFKTVDAKIAKKMKGMVHTAVKKAQLTELMRAKDNESNVKIYAKTSENSDTVSEVLMYLDGMNRVTEGQAEAIVVSLTGVIDVNKLATLADKFTK